MKKFMTSMYRTSKNFYGRLGLFLGLILIQSPIFAGIPAAPDINGGDSSDYIKTGDAVFIEIAKFAITGLYVISILAYAGALIWLFLQAKKHKEWGHFGKSALIGLGVLVLILFLLNEAKKALS